MVRSKILQASQLLSKGSRRSCVPTDVQVFKVQNLFGNDLNYNKTYRVLKLIIRVRFLFVSADRVELKTSTANVTAPLEYRDHNHFKP